MTEYSDLWSELNALKIRMENLYTQIEMLNPLEIIQFKATVIKTLGSIDKDMDSLISKVEVLNTSVWKEKVKNAGISATVSFLTALVLYFLTR